MLKFFRKIRQNLLSEGKVGTYLKYAVGEIILVVIGILIALQINNWNQERLNSKEERQLLEAIQIKMKHNRFQYETGYARYNDVIEAATQLIKLNTKQTNEYRQDELDYYLHVLSKRFLVGNSNKTSIYDEMIGSGQLNLLKSKELRSELTSLKANLELLASYEDLQNKFVDNHLNPFLNEHTDRLAIMVKGFEKDTTVYDGIIGEPYAEMEIMKSTKTHAILLRDSVFINLLAELIYHTNTLLPVYGRIAANIATIDSLSAISRREKSK
jgi:hypothetical protein